MNRQFQRRTRGATLAEVTVASAMSAVTLTAAVAVFLMSTASWARGESRIEGETNVRQAVRLVSDELREAMWVQVDADGMGLSYRKPVKEASGEFRIPVTWDGVTRRFEYQNGDLYLKEGSSTSRVIARHVMTKDPFRSSNHAMSSSISHEASNSSWASYKIFTPNVGSLTTEVTVMLVTGNRGGQTGEYVRARKREVVSLRNVPELIK